MISELAAPWTPHLALTASPGVVWLLAVTLAAGGGLLGLLLWVSRSIRELRRAADRLAKGDLSERVHVGGPLQITELAESLNRMAGQLQDRLATVSQQRNELTAVLSSMVEGVIAVDSEEGVLSLNPAAAEMLRLDATRAIGRPIQEVVRNPALQQFVTETLSDATPWQRDTVIRLTGVRGGEGNGQAYSSAADRHLQAQSAVLRDGGGRRLGAVVVLHDVTDIRRLEQIRSDFVANVSHEIRTPVSAIKAAIETLIDDQPEDPADVARFLQIGSRQADRLSAIVEDLLSLARIEQDAERIVDELEAEPVVNVINAAIETCDANAKEKSIEVQVDCDGGLRAMMQSAMLEQAVINLVDNAIKYSPESTHVHVSAELESGEVVLRVTDEGRGIEPDHLPRIFERFYRTDKARSRQMGGTGLGLSIVKHTAEAHGGRVSVESFPGTGSVFAIHLRPVRERAGDPPSGTRDAPAEAVGRDAE